MKIKYLGHACFYFEIGNHKIIVDPFITDNPIASDIDVDAIEVDYILLTHGHADHVADVERIVKNTGAKIISNFEVVNWFGAKGVEGHPMNHGGKWKFDFGYVKMVNAVHSSSMPDGSYGGNPAGFVIWNEDISFYIAGDTALTMDMQTIPLTVPKLDFCILPVGDNFTMGYEEAVIASDFVKCNKVIPCHFDTFGFIVVDKKVVKKAFEDKGKEIHFLEIGEDLTV